MFAALTFSFYFSVVNRRVLQDMPVGTLMQVQHDHREVNVSSDQPALYMAIPAPACFTDIRQHLHEAGIDAAYLSLTLENYLDRSENMPKQDWFLEPQEDHQAWAFREAISTFQEMIVNKADEGNGEET